MEILLILSMPVLASLFAFLPARKYTFVAFAFADFVLGCDLLYKVFHFGRIFALHGYLFADALSVILVMIITLLVLLTSIYSIPYNEMEKVSGWLEVKYYFFSGAFAFSMLLSVLANNLGIFWVAIEATTLSTAFLVSFYNTIDAVEAGWKYLILCSVGIALALLGIVILFFSAAPSIGYEASSLNWTNLVKAALLGKINLPLAKLAFGFIIVGLGTKEGLAPMHTWLPDAHSQAPSPISALLSGVLLNCAAAGILRVADIVGAAGGRDMVSSLLIFFGMISVLLAGIMLLRQKDYKRMLAYSSMEHMGLITFSSGLGGIGLFAALFHMLNHALTKTLLFTSAGNVLSSLHTREIPKIKGLFKFMPFTAVLLTLGTLAITGTPPFSVFMSEFLVVFSGIKTGHLISTLTVIVGLTLAFAGLVYNVSQMLFGKPTENKNMEVSTFQLFVPYLILITIVITAFYLPDPMISLMKTVQNSILRYV